MLSQKQLLSKFTLSIVCEFYHNWLNIKSIVCLHRSKLCPLSIRTECFTSIAVSKTWTLNAFRFISSVEFCIVFGFAHKPKPIQSLILFTSIVYNNKLSIYVMATFWFICLCIYWPDIIYTFERLCAWFGCRSLLNVAMEYLHFIHIHKIYLRINP